MKFILGYAETERHTWISACKINEFINEFSAYNVHVHKNWNAKIKVQV